VVLATSEQLARIAGPELEALTGWLLAGGALAVVGTRPEDLRGPTLSALTGGPIELKEVPEALKRPMLFLVALDPSSAPTLSSPSYGSSGIVWIRSLVEKPSTAIAERLVSYRGGNLHDSRWGASASYGLGEVHLLAFDTTRDPFASDPWVKLELIDLVRHVWERKGAVALPHAQRALDLPQHDHIRRALDPNEGTRWTIVVSAMLLLIYAALAGPVNFYLASRKGKPLRALLYLPIWAALAMLAIVLLGVFSKGVEGRARRLTLVEAGAGMPRGAATRFRGFYASSAERLTVRASEHSSVLDIAGESDGTMRSLVIDRDGARLERFRAKPWQMVVVREDGFSSLGGGVSLVRATNGEIQIKNRSARDLIAVVVKPPRKGAVFFERIRDGESVSTSHGEALSSAVGSGSYGSTSRIHPLGAGSFAAEANGAAKGLGDAWQALEPLTADTDWWPADVPALLAQVGGGEGRTSDSGLPVDVDRVLLRIVGWGGVL